MLSVLVSVLGTALIFSLGGWLKALGDYRSLKTTSDSQLALLNELKVSQLVTAEVMKAVKDLSIKKASG
jgi:hypothetical protein